LWSNNAVKKKTKKSQKIGFERSLYSHGMFATRRAAACAEKKNTIPHLPRPLFSEWPKQGRDVAQHAESTKKVAEIQKYSKSLALQDPCTPVIITL